MNPKKLLLILLIMFALALLVLLQNEKSVDDTFHSACKDICENNGLEFIYSSSDQKSEYNTSKIKYMCLCSE